MTRYFRAVYNMLCHVITYRSIPYNAIVQHIVHHNHHYRHHHIILAYVHAGENPRGEKLTDLALSV